jgi:hypothetical protein
MRRARERTVAEQVQQPRTTCLEAEGEEQIPAGEHLPSLTPRLRRRPRSKVPFSGCNARQDGPGLTDA